jgi:predicted transcriptional regulator
MESLRFAKTQKRCLEFIHENPGCSRNDVERGTGMRQASVSGRVRDLLDKEMVYEEGAKKDPVTGESNNLLWCSCCADSAGFYDKSTEAAA